MTCLELSILIDVPSVVYMSYYVNPNQSPERLILQFEIPSNTEMI